VLKVNFGLALMFLFHGLIEGLGLAFGDREGFSSSDRGLSCRCRRSGRHGGDSGQLAVDGVDGDERFVADGDGFEQVLVFEGAQGIQEAAPSLFPIGG